jgi:hypothetical protein
MCRGLRRTRRLSPPYFRLAVELTLVMKACASKYRLSKPLYAYEYTEISIVSGAAQAGEVPGTPAQRGETVVEGDDINAQLRGIFSAFSRI